MAAGCLRSRWLWPGAVLASTLVGAACDTAGGGATDGGVSDGGAGDGGAAVPGSCDAGAAAIIGEAGFSSVDDAVAAAADDDTVAVCPGTHSVALSVTGRRIAIVGATGEVDDVQLSPSGTDPVLNIGPGSAVSVADLVIADTPEGDTAAVRVDEASLVLRRVVLRDNAGGGLRVQAATEGSASLTVEDCTLTGNRTTAPGGAIAATGGGRVDLVVSASSLVGNESELGGAIYAGSGSGSVRVEGSVLTGNTAASLGGGLASLVDEGDLTVTDSELSANTARDGGGLFLSERAERSSLSVSDSVLVDNIATQQGGAMYLGAADSSVALSGLRIEGNGADDGGGIYLMGAEDTTVALSIVDTTLLGNRAGRSGGALRVVGAGLTGGITLRGGGVEGNESEDAAVVLDVGLTLDGVKVDWGQGKLDNLPADLSTPLLTWDDLGAGETLSCDATGACTR